MCLTRQSLRMMIALLALGLLLPAPVPRAQEEEGEPEYRPPSAAVQRQKRYRERMDKFEELVKKEKERLRQEAEEKRQQVLEEQMEEKRVEQAAEQVIEATEAPAIVMLMLRPFSQSVRVGQRFTNQLSLRSELRQRYDGFVLRLEYNPLDMEPLRVFDFPIAESLDPENPPEFSMGDGVLHYEARFAEPRQIVGEEPLLYVVWQARNASQSSLLRMSNRRLAGEPGETAVWQDDLNLLEDESVVGKATMGAMVLIKDESRLAAPGILLRDSRVAPVTLAARLREGQHVDFRLEPLPREEQAEDADRVVDILLENPDRLPIDHVRLVMAYDPEALEVLDWDYQGWVRLGVNLFDAHAHQRYPFTLHRSNAVYPHMGRIEYDMGMVELRPLESGSLARVRCRELRPGGLETLRVLRDTNGPSQATDVRAQGVSLMPGAAERLAEGTSAR